MLRFARPVVFRAVFQAVQDRSNCRSLAFDDHDKCDSWTAFQCLSSRSQFEFIQTSSAWTDMAHMRRTRKGHAFLNSNFAHQERVPQLTAKRHFHSLRPGTISLFFTP